MLINIAFILICGVISNRLFALIRMPGFMGMIFCGVILGPYGMNIIHPDLLKYSAEIRVFALIVILLRAGLGLNPDVLKRVGGVAVRMSVIPCLVEGFTVTMVAHYLLHIPLLEAGVLGFVLAAVSPAVVIPTMLFLKEKSLGMNKGIPVIILAGASADDVMAITMFSIFLGIAGQKSVQIWTSLGMIPIKILSGIALGLLGGWVLCTIVWRKRSRWARMEQLALLIALAVFIATMGDRYQIAGLLGVMALGFFLLVKANGIAVHLEKELTNLWFFAHIFLFFLIGAEVNIQVVRQAGLISLAVIGIGLIGRSVGVWVALAGTELNIKERIFCAIAFLPKATVQAAMGGIPMAAGLASGSVILAIAVMAIIISAPLGALGIQYAAPRLLEYDETVGDVG